MSEDALSLDPAFTSDVPAVPPREQRRAAVAFAAKSLEAGHWIMYRHAYRQLAVAAVRHELLLYRAANGRLTADLQERFKGNDAALSGFLDGEEQEEVQRLLHNLLLGKAGDLGGPVFQELQRVAQQVEPLLITADGVVVNGNRRLAAMRELLHRDASRYGSFSNISVACLPEDAQRNDIEFVEASLQMAPETKLVYGWLNRRIKLREQLEVLKLPVERIVESYRFKTEAELKTEIAELDLVEQYLREFLGTPYAYSAAEDAEILFVAMQAHLQNLSVPLREVWRMLGFVMIHGGRQHKGLEHLYPFSNPAPRHLPSWALRRLAARWGIAQFEQTTDVDLSAPVRTDLLAYLSNPSKSREVAQEVIELLEMLRMEHTHGRAPDRMLHKLKQAGHLISRLEPTSLTGSHRRQLRVHVAELQAQASYLLGDIEQAQKAKAVRKRANNALRKLPRRMLDRLGFSAFRQGATKQ